MDSIITLTLAAISFILIVYNFLLKRTLNNRRDQDIKELEGQIRESKNESNKTAAELNDLIKQYRKLRGGSDTDKPDS